MKSTELRQKTVVFIKQVLIPEMVYDRCFCEKASREFVEFDSATVEPANPSDEPNGSCEIYRVKAVLKFSGEDACIPLVVKLVADDSPTAFDAFQNEEMFHAKMTLKYGTDYTPKCYLSDLGRYGRPVIVLEDLEARGYARVTGRLDGDHLKLCADALGKFHGRGLRLKAEEFEIFREFYAKLTEVTFAEEFVNDFEKRSARVADLLKSLADSKVAGKIKRKLGESLFDAARNAASEINDVSTICQGHFSPDNLLFKYENEKPIDVRVIDWQTMRYCSPAIDLAAVLFSDTTRETGPSMLEEILTPYIDAVKREYPVITGERLRDDIADKFPVACVVLSLREKFTDEELVRTLLQLEREGVFD